MNLSNKTIEQLRKSGYKCRVHHYRHVRNDGQVLTYVPLMDIQNRNNMTPKGGKTTLFVTTPDEKNYRGVALCNDKDSFNYKIAVKICLGRLQEVTN